MTEKARRKLRERLTGAEPMTELYRRLREARA